MNNCSSANIFSEEGLNRFLEIAYPRTFKPEAIYRDLTDNGSRTSFQSIAKLIDFYLEAGNVSVENPDVHTWEYVPLESIFLQLVQNTNKANSFLSSDDLRRMDSQVRKLLVTGVSFKNCIEKALFQRDIYQIIWIIARCHDCTDSTDEKTSAENVLSDFRQLFHETLLSESELYQLRSTHPSTVGFPFTTNPTFDLSQDYLPAVILRSDNEWYEIPFQEKASKHFRDFGGRSFIKVYIKIPGYSGTDVAQMWDFLSRKYGSNLHMTGSALVPPLPAKSEVALIRSIGTFMADGTYTDSGIIEEVLVRQFKYAFQRLDAATSDMRGTLFFQYKMDRKRLLTNPGTFGFIRIHDGDPECVGFYSEVPDPHNAYGSGLGTMRMNCIGCHSECMYGTSTIFSFEHAPAASQALSLLQDGALKSTATPGRYVPLMREFLLMKGISK